MINKYNERQDFGDFIKNYISDSIDSLEGENLYTCDLGMKITEEDNVNGTVFVCTEDNKQFIKNNWDKASETHNYLKDDIGIIINPFEDPCSFAFAMVEKAVQDILSDSKYISEHWDESIELTPEVINQIKKECQIEYEGKSLDDTEDEEEPEL